MVATLSAVVGLAASWGSWAIGSLLAPSASMAINTSAEWRLMFGQAFVYALSAIFAIAIGILIRQSAGAIAILILWPLLVESLLPLIPKIGDDLQKWTPFTNANCSSTVSRTWVWPVRTRRVPPPRCRRGGRWSTSPPGLSAC